MTTTTEMIVADEKYEILNPASNMAQLVAANMDGEEMTSFDLTKVSMPTGGGLMWEIEDDTGAVQTDAIEGILVAIKQRGLLWPEEEPSDSPPVLVSDDLITARLGCDIDDVPADMLKVIREHEVKGQPGVFDWKSLPYTQFGSGKGGSGKRAKEHRLLFILRENEPFPLWINAGPGSVGIVRKFRMKLRVPMHQAIVRVTLTKEVNKGGQKYSRLAMARTGQLSDEAARTVYEKFTTPLSRVDIPVDDDAKKSAKKK